MRTGQFTLPIPEYNIDLERFVPAIIGLQGFFPLKGQAAVGVGSIEYPATERKRLAALYVPWRSISWQLISSHICQYPDRENGLVHIANKPILSCYPTPLRRVLTLSEIPRILRRRQQQTWKRVPRFPM